MLGSVALAVLAAWSAAETISVPRTYVTNQGVAATQSGFSVATWAWQDPDAAGSSFAVRGRERRLPGDVAAGPVAFGRESWAVPTLTPGRVAVVFGRGARTPRVGRVFRGRGLVQTQLASNSRGRMALAWTGRRGAFVAVRAPGRRFGPARRIGDRARTVAVDVAPDGDVLVAWESGGVVRVRLRSTRVIGRGRTTHLRAVMTRSGRANVAWIAQRGAESDAGGPISVRVAMKPSGQGWRDSLLLERAAGSLGVRGLGLSGDAVAWVGDGPTVRYATVGTSGRFETHDLPGGAGHFRVDDLSGGTLALTRYFGEDAATGSQVMASRDLAAPEPVSAEQEAYGGRVAGSRLVWVNRPEGSRRPTSQLRTVIESALGR